MIRLAAMQDLDVILRVYDKARQFMRASGNMRQWVDGYPKRELLESDIENQQLFVIEEDGVIHAAFAFILGDDPTYAYIEDGKWPNGKPYGTIHRIGTDGTIHGAVRMARDYALQFTGEVRADTHADNASMRRALEKSGFVLCGKIRTAHDEPRVAYEKRLCTPGE